MNMNVGLSRRLSKEEDLHFPVSFNATIDNSENLGGVCFVVVKML